MRVIDLITGLDMSAFHSQGGWNKMLDRLEQEVAYCAREVPGILPSELKPAKMSANGGGSDGKGQKSREGGESGDQSTSEDLVLLRYEETRMETSVNELDTTLKQSEEQDKREGGVAEDGGPLICMPERAALIKSILNFLKKAIPEPTFAENIRTCTSIPILHFLLIIVFLFSYSCGFILASFSSAYYQ